MEFEEFLDMFNNGELDVESYFNDYETWFNVLKRRGLMSQLDPINGTDSESWQNEFLLWLYDNDRGKYYYWVDRILNDVTIENDKIYFVGDREDLSLIFCDGRRYDWSQETISNFLEGEDIFERYWNTTEDVYKDVIEELDGENLKILKKSIIEQLKNKKLSPETEEMELIAAEQGHNDFWEITEDNVSRIIDDEDSMNSLLNDELRDIKGELYSVHSNSYNSAYEEEVWDDLWKEVNKYFEGKGEWIYKPHAYKENTQIQKFKIPIIDFEEHVNDYLYANKNYGRSGSLEYLGTYMEMLKETIDCIGFQPSDYPDFRKVDRNINEYFKEYF